MQGNIVTPLVYRRAVHLHPAVILLAIPAGGALAGIIGMFLRGARSSPCVATDPASRSCACSKASASVWCRAGGLTPRATSGRLLQRSAPEAG